jgi:TonB family protein
MSSIQFVIVNICLIFLVLIYKTLLSKDSNLRANRIYLLLAPIISIIIAYCRIPSDSMPILLHNVIELQAITINTTTSSNTISTLNILFLIYLGMAGFLLTRLIYAIIKTLKLKRQYSFTYNGIEVYSNETNNHSFAFFNRIILAKDKIGNTQVLHHEFAHTKYGHSFDTVFAEILRCIFWFNPVVHLWIQSLKLNHEYTADRYVADQTRDKGGYIKNLLSETFQTETHLIIGSPFSKNSDLVNRIYMLKHLRNNKIMKHLTIIPISIILIFSASLLNPTRALGQSPDSSKVISSEDLSPASFPGGNEAFQKFLVSNIKYPKVAIDANIEETVIVRFMVNKRGKVSFVKVLKGENKSLIEEAKRVISVMPKWEPARSSGKRVTYALALPFKFQLPEEL